MPFLCELSVMTDQDKEYFVYSYGAKMHKKLTDLFSKLETYDLLVNNTYIFQHLVKE